MAARQTHGMRFCRRGSPAGARHSARPAGGNSRACKEGRVCRTEAMRRMTRAAPKKKRQRHPSGKKSHGRRLFLYSLYIDFFQLLFTAAAASFAWRGPKIGNGKNALKESAFCEKPKPGRNTSHDRRKTALCITPEFIRKMVLTAR